MNLRVRYLLGLFFVIAGIGFLLGIDVWRFFWPAVLILLGIRMLSNTEEKSFYKADEESGEEVIDDTVAFHELNKKITSNNFRGGRVTTIFGGGVLDLREAKITAGKPAELEVTAIFGGIKILVPEEWMVNGSLVGILGGFTNNTKGRLNKNGETGQLNIRGTAVLGGGEVTN